MKRKLFRYRSFDNEIVNDYSYIHQRMVNVEKWKFEAFEGLVYPSSPLYFNDPYDGHGVIGYPKALVEDRHQAQHMQAVAVVKILENDCEKRKPGTETL